MIGVGVSVVAALGTLVVVLLLLRFPRAAGGEADERVAAVALDMRSRMEAMRRQLGDALERAQREAGRNRIFSELSTSTTPEAVARRALELARSLTGADAAALAAGSPGTSHVAATVGLSADEARLFAGVRVPDGTEPQSAIFTFRNSYDGAVRSALAVRLPADWPSPGHIAVFSRADGRTFGSEETAELVALAAGVTTALANARLVEEARTLADSDPTTGLPHRRRFAEILAQAVNEAKAAAQPLTVALWDLEDFGAINRRLGDEAGDEALRTAAERARPLLPRESTLARIGADEIAALLPGARLDDANAFLRRLARSLAASPVPRAGRLSFSGAVAELDPGEDAAGLFQRAEHALARARGGAGVIVTAESWALEPQPR